MRRKRRSPGPRKTGNGPTSDSPTWRSPRCRAWGPPASQTLLTAYPSPLGAHSAPFEFLCTLPGFSRAMATALKETPLATGQKTLDAAEQLGVSVLLPDEPEYPMLLRHIPDPPPVLFALGNRTLLLPASGRSGRQPRPFQLWSLGMPSGCGRGSPGWSGNRERHGPRPRRGSSRRRARCRRHNHRSAGQRTSESIYPAANRGLYERVSAEGLLLSEFAPGERPHAGSFPRRNRLISGLSRVTVVVEAAVGSGALITAGTALDQGREVMAVPGNITSPVSAGTNRLIRDGATPLLEPGDLLQHFPELGSPRPKGTRLPRTNRPCRRPCRLLKENWRS